MPTPKKRRPTKGKKQKGKVTIMQEVQIRKKGDKKYNLPNAPTRFAGDNGANFRIKIRRKT